MGLPNKSQTKVVISFTLAPTPINAFASRVFVVIKTCNGTKKGSSIDVNGNLRLFIDIVFRFAFGALTFYSAQVAS